MTRRRRRPPRVQLPGLLPLLLSALLWGLVVGVVACTDAPRAGEALADDAVPEAERRGGTAVVAGRVGIATLNPLVSTDHLAAQVQKHLLYTPLLQQDSLFQPRPWLAEAWELNEDSTQVLFRLREDVTWHDGTPITGRDVAFTFARVRDPRIGYPNRAWFDLWEGAETPSTREVRLALRKHAGYLFGWTQLPILPAHLLSDVPSDRLGTHPLGPDGPIGSGPFRFSGREGTDRWAFEANPDFPASLGGPPLLDRLVYRQLPDETSLLAELRNGGVHLVIGVPAAAVERLRSDPAVRVLTYPSRTVVFIAWNTRRVPFQDADVRRAIGLALDREGLLAAVRGGLGEVASGPVGPWHWAHETGHPDFRPLPHAPDSARALLERAGWRDTDGDGVRDRDGHRLRFELLTTDSRMRQDIATIAQSQLAAVGVDVVVRTMESAAVGAAVTSAERRFDGVVLAFAQDWELDEREQWACDRVGQPFHFSSYCDPELDEVLSAIPVTLDREERRELYRRFHRIIARDEPYTYLWFETTAVAARQELRGVQADARGPLASAREWWLHPDARSAGR